MCSQRGAVGAELTRSKVGVVNLGPVNRIQNLLELLVLVAELFRLLRKAFRLEDVVDANLFGFTVEGNLTND